MATKTEKLSAAVGLGSLKVLQLEVLQRLGTKHLSDAALLELLKSESFGVTSTERGVPRFEHAHLVTCLDIVSQYQRSRLAKGACGPGWRRSYTGDPRTRCVELLKAWLRANAVNAAVSEDEVRRFGAFVRDIMNYPQVFPSRNKPSFMHTLAEVYDHLKLQLREVLQRDRTCAELASRAIVVSRNLISDAVAYLLLGPTCLEQTDKLPSIEVVCLWQSLPSEMNPLRNRAIAEQQKDMKEAWETLCGSLVAHLLTMRWAFRLFGGQKAEEEAVRNGLALRDAPSPAAIGALQDAAERPRPSLESSESPKAPMIPPQKETGAQSPESRISKASTKTGKSQRSTASGHPVEEMGAHIAKVREEFQKGRFGSSGLAGVFRDPEQAGARQTYLGAVEALVDLVYLLGEVFVQFHRISDGLGDYGTIRVAPWLHPFLEALVEKVQRLKGCLEALFEAVDTELVVAKARGRKVKKPCPSDNMSSRAHAAVDRAILGKDNHAALLVQTLDELRGRSAPERLPHVVQGLTDACAQLQDVLSSPQFRARVGDSFPEMRLTQGGSPVSQAALTL